ncbi:alpha-ketoacid dehydrogenase subunit beta [Rickettsiales bacterium LUAb2]
METKQMNFIEAITLAIKEEMRRDPKVFILGEDVGKKGGVFKASEGLYDEFGALRVLDTPLSESLIAGLAVGASMYGYRPIAEMQFVDFILPAVNQIVSEAAKMRYRTASDWTCPMVVRAPCGGGIHGGLYHSQSIEAMFANTPGLQIVMPSNPYDAKGLLKSAIRSDDPVLFFEHKRAYRSIIGEVPLDDYTIPIGVADVKREGEDITVITYGICVNLALEVAEKLHKERGASIHILDLRTVYPLDKAAIVKAAEKTGKVLLISEANLEGNIISEVSAIIAENCLFSLDAPVRRLAAPDVPSMPYSSGMERFVLVDAEKIEQAMISLLDF